VKILNLTKNTLVAERASLADTFVSRMIGLLGRSSMQDSEALIITHCQSIHMFFMRFAIDALFVDSNDRVVGKVEGIKPFRLSPIYWGSSYCIELPAGAIQKNQTSVGDRLKIDKSI
jgi:uncharacterized membrane protein (UPF0127 family)